MQPTAMPIVACGETIQGGYNNSVATFNIDVPVASTVVFNATKSFGEWVQSLVGIEVYLPDGSMVADGDENDLYSNEFIVLGIENGEPGIYQFVFFVGSLEPPEDPREGYYGQYVIEVSCIVDEVTADSNPVMFAMSNMEEQSAKWFSRDSVSGSVTLSEVGAGVLILWVAVVLLCSVGTAIALGYNKGVQKFVVLEEDAISNGD